MKKRGFCLEWNGPFCKQHCEFQILPAISYNAMPGMDSLTIGWLGFSVTFGLMTKDPLNLNKDEFVKALDTIEKTGFMENPFPVMNLIYLAGC
jgi:hypothetical protein